MQQYAIIVAGGTGSRMQSAKPKQFLLLAGKPILQYSIQTFLSTYADINIIVVSHKNYVVEVQQIINDCTPNNNIEIAMGGDTRYNSVQNGLALIPDNVNGIVYVHDAARPFINASLLHQLQQDCLANNNAIPVIPIAESLRKVIDINQSEIVNRDEIKIVQTPQVFKASIIKQAFAQTYQDHFTDEASVCENYVEAIFLSQGIEQNIKITTPHQLQLAECMIASWNNLL